MHTRLPVVIPDRLTPELFHALTQTRLRPVLVLHTNHANELSDQLAHRLQEFAKYMPVLNQSVLLAGINDSAEVLRDLSEALFDARIQPYYLFLLDRVAGAAHFEVDEKKATSYMLTYRGICPGFWCPSWPARYRSERRKP